MKPEIKKLLEETLQLMQSRFTTEKFNDKVYDVFIKNSCTFPFPVNTSRALVNNGTTLKFLRENCNQVKPRTYEKRTEKKPFPITQNSVKEKRDDLIKEIDKHNQPDNIERMNQLLINNAINLLKNNGFLISKKERCSKELFIEKYYGLASETTNEKTAITTDFGQLVNLLTMYVDESNLLNACKAAKAIFEAQGITENCKIVGEIYKQITDAIKQNS